MLVSLCFIRPWAGQVGLLDLGQAAVDVLVGLGLSCAESDVPNRSKNLVHVWRRVVILDIEWIVSFESLLHTYFLPSVPLHEVSWKVGLGDFSQKLKFFVELEPDFV